MSIATAALQLATTIVLFVGVHFATKKWEAIVKRALGRDLLIEGHAPWSPDWPPPFASNKGMRQDLTVEGFAITSGNGSVFIHMKPIARMGGLAAAAADVEYQTLQELRWRLLHASQRLEGRLIGIERDRARARLEADPNDRDALKTLEALEGELAIAEAVAENDTEES